MAWPTTRCSKTTEQPPFITTRKYCSRHSFLRLRPDSADIDLHSVIRSISYHITGRTLGKIDHHQRTEGPPSRYTSDRVTIFYLYFSYFLAWSIIGLPMSAFCIFFHSSISSSGTSLKAVTSAHYLVQDSRPAGMTVFSEEGESSKRSLPGNHFQGSLGSTKFVHRWSATR